MRPRNAYEQGRWAAFEGKKKIPPATFSFEMRHWWLAGYSDWEIENAR